MPLAYHFVGQYEKWHDRDAMLSAAMEGLWRAAEQWDPATGVPMAKRKELPGYRIGLKDL